MNIKKWASSGVAAFVVVFILDFLVHGKLLMGLYNQTASVWRPQAEAGKLMWLMTVTQVLFAFALAWFYTLGYEPAKTSLAQGIRFGLYVGIVLVAAQGFIWYVVLPVPFILNLGWLASAFVNSIAAGTVIGVIYRK